MTDQDLLGEIKLMARADHAWRLTRDYNPYPEGDPRAAAWAEGWHAEDDRVQRLDEEIVKLPQFRVAIEIVSGETPLMTVTREDLAGYTVSNMRGAGPRAVIFESSEAKARFPEHPDVRVRVTYEGDGGMFD